MIKLDDTPFLKIQKYIDNCKKKLKTKNVCILGFQNTSGTCWYSSILSILCFSDFIGKRFVKALFELSRRQIYEKVDKLKELRKKYDFPTLKGSDLEGVPKLLESVKMRIYKIMKNEKDLEEERMCYIVNRTRYIESWLGHKEYGECILSDTNPLLKQYVLNTFTYIVLNELYDYKVYPPKSSIHKENIVAYFVETYNIHEDSHISCIYKFDNQYVHHNDDIMIKISREPREINTYLNSNEIILHANPDIINNKNNKIHISNMKKDIYYLTPNTQDITKHEISNEKKQMYLFVEEIKNGNTIDIKLYDTIVKRLNDNYPTYEGKDLIIWSIIHNNIHAVIQLLDYYNHLISIPASCISPVHLFLSFHKNIEIFKCILQRANYIDKIYINEKNEKGKNIIMEIRSSKNIDSQTKTEYIELLKKKSSVNG